MANDTWSMKKNGNDAKRSTKWTTEGNRQNGRRGMNGRNWPTYASWQTAGMSTGVLDGMKTL